MKARQNTENALHGGDSTALPEQALELGGYVAVRVEQRIPPERVSGQEVDWKDLGPRLLGRLMNGPQSVLSDPENGRYHYVSPLRKFESDGGYGNTHPRQIEDGKELEIRDDRTGEVTDVIRCFVEVAGARLTELAVQMDTDEPIQK